jgi:molecular chaperone GrpE
MRSSTKSVKGADSAPDAQTVRDKAATKEPPKNASQQATPKAHQHQENVSEAPAQKSEIPAQNEAAAQSEPRETVESREQLEDRLLRALAEQANIHERALREIDRATKFAGSQFAGDLLETLDNLRLAIASIPKAASADSEMKPLIAGIIATERALMSALAKHGVEPIDALDQPFDPAFHEAVHLVPGHDRPAGTVVEVIKPGYMHHDRLLRPAAVHVATPESNGG